jgi:hypothetical protein
MCLTVGFEEEERRRLRKEDAFVASCVGGSAFGAIFRFLDLFMRDSSQQSRPPPRATRFLLDESSQMAQIVRVHYHRTVFDQFDTDEEIWRHYLSVAGANAGRALLDEVTLLLALPPKQAFQTVNALCCCEGETFITPVDELTSWLKELKAFLERVTSGERS